MKIFDPNGVFTGRCISSRFWTSLSGYLVGLSVLPLYFFLSGHEWVSRFSVWLPIGYSFSGLYIEVCKRVFLPLCLYGPREYSLERRLANAALGLSFVAVVGVILLFVQVERGASHNAIGSIRFFYLCSLLTYLNALLKGMSPFGDGRK